MPEDEPTGCTHSLRDEFHVGLAKQCASRVKCSPSRYQITRYTVEYEKRITYACSEFGIRAREWQLPSVNTPYEIGPNVELAN
jgi:hypothetical protein